ncbi:MAG: hypothetical protein AAFQ82_09780, partial [Myxococcota bacterium]
IGREAVATENLDVYASATDDPSAGLEEKQLRGILSRRLTQQLPPRGLLICKMLYVDHATPDRIADALGVSKQVVYNWQHKIRTLAREILE